jgi:hypothetical protein
MVQKNTVARLRTRQEGAEGTTNDSMTHHPSIFFRAT